MGENGRAADVAKKIVVYQLVVRLFGNTNETRKKDGTLEENGVGKFADIDERALTSLASLGITHVWLTGVLRQATLTDWSDYGMPADPPDVVKGRAGSFYAIRDYYDVCPDYAVDPEKRHAEFDALVARVHAAGLRVLIDLVPNHVARTYASVVKPELDFGKDDDQRLFFSPRNDFFYLADPPGQSLRTTKPPHWNPPGVVFTGSFDRERGGDGHVPKVTGNNVVSSRPGPNDWYETVKLNYGFDFASGASRFEPMPSVWTKIDAILAHWQSRGVDGFRCDFAHWVPEAAWRWLLARVKERDPQAFVVAEAYENLGGLLASGFDAVYHDEAYDTLKLIYTGARTLDDLESLLGSLDDAARAKHVLYLENHDERRIASPIVGRGGPDATGFGSANAAHQVAPIAYLYSNAPVLFFNGQEVGEEGAGDEGFGGEDGRTTIFDYGAMPELAKWVNGHRYDGGRLSAEQRALRAYYGDLLALAQDPRVRGAGYWGLRYVCSRLDGSRASEAFAFARFADGGGSLLIVVANFAPGRSIDVRVRIPDDLASRAGLHATAPHTVCVVLDKGGATNDRIDDAATRASLASEGFVVGVSNQSAKVIVVSPRG